MISNPEHWKRNLLKTAQILREFNSKKELSEDVLLEIEKEIFFGFYSIRKLREAYSIPDTTYDKKRTITYYLHSGTERLITQFTKDEVNQFYNLNNKQSETKDLKFIADNLIHSFIFTIDKNDASDFKGIWFSSDKTKEKKVHYLSADDIVNIFQEVGGSEIDSGTLDVLYFFKKCGQTRCDERKCGEHTTCKTTQCGEKKLKDWLTEFWGEADKIDVVFTYYKELALRPLWTKKGTREIKISASDSRSKQEELLEFTEEEFCRKIINKVN